MAHIKYFAYGSNMHEEDLKRWCKRRGYDPIIFLKKEVAMLKNWRLEFNYYSETRGGGTANIVYSPGDEVWGLLVEITKEDFEKIREKEGAPKCYEEIEVCVMTRDGKIVSNVKTFKVVKERESKLYQPPTREYLSLLIEAAKKYRFPEWYIKRLESLPVT